jgi:hypothetical protein
MEEWFWWVNNNPVTAIAVAGGVAAGVLVLRFGVVALARRLLFRARLRDRVEQASPWATGNDLVAYGLLPARRRWWQIRRRS